MNLSKITVGKVPFDLWDVDAMNAIDSSMTDEVKQRMTHGGFVTDLDLFDAKIFNMSSAEASVMDLQHLLLLECAHIAFRDDGYSKSDLKGKNIGVSVGLFGSDAFGLEFSAKISSACSANATSHSTASGRVSFVFWFTWTFCCV